MIDKGALPGDFDFQTLMGPCPLQLAEMQPHRQIHNMPLHANYIWGGLRGRDGEFFVIERKFVGAMTSGLNLMAAKNGMLDLAPENARSTCGEVRRHFTPATRQWSNNLLHAVASERLTGRDQGLDLTLDDQTFQWSEGELLTLSGSTAGTGIQFFTAMASTPCMIHEQPFRAKGTLLGVEVEGYILLDHFYALAGCDWKSHPIYAEVETTLDVFANLFEDGTTEYGMILGGRRGFNAGIVVEGDEITGCSSAVRGSVTLDGNSIATGATYDFGDAEWEFTPEAQIGDWAKARPGGYQVHQGITRRKGDTRRVVDGYSWFDCFAERVREEGQVKG